MKPDAPLPPHAQVALHNAQLLTSLRRERAAAFALVSERSDEVVALVQGDRGVMAATGAGTDLAQALAREKLWAVRRRTRELGGSGSFSLDRVRWNFGVRYGLSHGLGPWLAADAAFQMLDWPDFRVLGGFMLAQQVCRALSGPPQTVDALVRATGDALPAVHAALNAISLCGLVHQHAPAGRRKY